MKKLTGKITIGRTTGRDENPVSIHIDDEISGCRVLQVSMTLEDFARATFGQGWIPCLLEVNLDGPIGMKAENKTEIVPYDMCGQGYRNKAAAAKALKPFEIDGWRARADDMSNGHCRTADGKGQRVVFFRHVDPETGKPV